MMDMIIRCIQIQASKITAIERLNILLFKLNHNVSHQTYKTSAPDKKHRQLCLHIEHAGQEPRIAYLVF